MFAVIEDIKFDKRVVKLKILSGALIIRGHMIPWEI